MNARSLIRYLIIFGAVFFGAVAHAKPGDEPCPLTSKNLEWSAACFETTPAGRQVKAPYLKNIIRNRKGHAAIVITAPPELVMLDRRGKIVPLKKEYLGDFDFEPRDAEGDIVRFGYLTKKHADKSPIFKCGFYLAGKKFKVLVPPVYDNCDSFNEDRALVCFDCTNHCEGGDCHETDFIGGEGLVINDKNEVLKRFALPTLPRCGDGPPKESGDAKCRPRPPDPFSELK